MFNNGNVKNYPEIISKYDYKTWNLLKLNGRICFESSKFCNFYNKRKNKIFLLGDSVAGSLSYDLKEKLSNSKYGFVSAAIGCWYLPNFNEFDISKRYFNEINNECSALRQNDLRNQILNTNNSIVVLAGKLPRDNSIHVNKKIDYKEGIKKSILELADKGHYVLLVYPLPNLDFNPLDKLINNYKLNKSISIFTKPISNYFDENNIDYDLLNNINHKNIIKIYPDKVFCNSFKKNQCVFNDNNNLFDVDEQHPSLEGSQLINNLILKEINKL